jgi:rRNA processing protein Gar1
MKKLGTVKNVIHDGTILVSALETPAPGAKVYDLRGAEVGRVSRVFGPVNGPYVSVRPKAPAEPLGLLESTLYLGSEEQAEFNRPHVAKRKTPREQHGRFKARSGEISKKKGVNTWQRKEKPRKK